MGFPLPSLPTIDSLDASRLEVPEPEVSQLVIQRAVAAECMRMLRRARETATADRWTDEPGKSSTAS